MPSTALWWPSSTSERCRTYRASRRSLRHLGRCLIRSARPAERTIHRGPVGFRQSKVGARGLLAAKATSQGASERLAVLSAEHARVIARDDPSLESTTGESFAEPTGGFEPST